MLKFIFTLIISLIKMFFHKFIVNLFKECTFKFHYVQRISILTSINQNKNSKIVLKKNTCISKRCSIYAASNSYLEIGNRVFINTGCIISCRKKIVIGDNCIIGPDVKFYDNDHKFDENGVNLKEHITGDIIIGEGTWIGANVVILRNTIIGKNCVVGAGAVIKGVYPDNSLILQERKIKVKSLEKNA